MLNALSTFIPRDERLVTWKILRNLFYASARDPAETRNANTEGTGEGDAAELGAKQLAYATRPDSGGRSPRSRGPGQLQAMNTGHEGSLTTITPTIRTTPCLRLEMMVAMTGFELPVQTWCASTWRRASNWVSAARPSQGGAAARDPALGNRRSGDGEYKLETFSAFEQTGVDANGNAAGEFRHGLRAGVPQTPCNRPECTVPETIFKQRRLSAACEGMDVIILAMTFLSATLLAFAVGLVLRDVVFGSRESTIPAGTLNLRRLPRLDETNSQSLTGRFDRWFNRLVFRDQPRLTPFARGDAGWCSLGCRWPACCSCE